MRGLILDNMIMFKCILKKCGLQSSDSEQRKMAGCGEDVDSPTQAGELLEQLLKYLSLLVRSYSLCACPSTYRLLSLLSCRRGCDNMQATWIFSLFKLLKKDVNRVHTFGINTT
jgi:hypothetical protein